jgi:hypothetical protein
MPTVPQNEALIKHLAELLQAHRPAFGQERVFLRVVGFVFGEIMTFTRHTVTQVLVAMGLAAVCWSGWYRLFSRKRFDEAAVAAVLFQETLQHVGPDAVYVVGGDGTQIARDSQKMEGSSWLKCPRNPPFKRSIHRAQRFFHGAWLLPPEDGYSRALPLRLLPAFNPKAVRQEHNAVTEGEAGLAYMRWVREQLDAAGRTAQPVLGLFDGSYDTLAWWKGLPAGVVTLVRTAKNRDLRELYTGTDRRRKYGPKALTPDEWLQVKDGGWTTTHLRVRRRKRRMVYRVEGPCIRYGAADTPLFLIVVRGERYTKNGKQKYRQPAYYLVNALQAADGSWVLPLPIEPLLFWAWQRWELEVTHREMKTDFGVGDKQCWHPHSAVSAVQWGAWVYAILVLAGYRTFGLCSAPPLATAWWSGARRWSWPRLLNQYRAVLLTDAKYTPCWPAIPTNWGDKEAALRDLFVPLPV